MRERWPTVGFSNQTSCSAIGIAGPPSPWGAHSPFDRAGLQSSRRYNSRNMTIQDKAQRRFGSVVVAVATVVVASAGLAGWLSAQALDAIVYTVRVPAPDTHFVEVEAAIPTGGRAAVELMMPVWSPGYYRIENYADRVDNVSARTPDGKALTAEKTQKNRWRVATNSGPSVLVSYRVFCNQRSVTTNNVTAEMGVLNGAPTFMTLVENAKRPHEVHLELPASWKGAMSGLDDAPDGQPSHFRAADYETLVDSPIMAGDLRVGRFVVDGKPHFVVGAGDIA